MHAPTVLQHYLVAMNNTESIPMLDMADYFRKWVSTKDLRRHIWEFEGGSSKEFLKLICDIQPNLKTTKPSEYLQYMQKYGPALVSNFGVTEEFKNTNHNKIFTNWTEEKPLNPPGCHAMVLVGHRMDETLGEIFLLQNWWKNKVFIETTGDYIELSGATVSFVSAKQLKIPTDFATNSHEHVEVELDCPERYQVEGN